MGGSRIRGARRGVRQDTSMNPNDAADLNDLMDRLDAHRRRNGTVARLAC